MNQFNNTVGNSAQVDLGLKNFMLGTYRYMAAAMAVTAGVSYGFSQYLMVNPAAMKLVFSPVSGIVAFLVIVFGFGAVGRKLPSMSQGAVVAFLFGFAAFLGVFTSGVAIIYDPMVIAKIFFMTVAMFAALSLFGYSTERNLQSFLKYAMAAVIGFIAIQFAGMFFPALRPSGPLDIVIQLVGLGGFAFFAAWETQMLKRIYYQSAGNPAMMNKMSAYGAASMLLTFVNMFQILLSLFGGND